MRSRRSYSPNTIASTRSWSSGTCHCRRSRASRSRSRCHHTASGTVSARLCGYSSGWLRHGRTCRNGHPRFGPKRPRPVYFAGLTQARFNVAPISRQFGACRAVPPSLCALPHVDAWRPGCAQPGIRPTARPNPFARRPPCSCRLLPSHFRCARANAFGASAVAARLLPPIARRTPLAHYSFARVASCVGLDQPPTAGPKA